MREHLIIIAAGLIRTASVEVVADIERKSTLLYITAHTEARLITVLVHRVVSGACVYFTVIFIMESKNKRLSRAIKHLTGMPLLKAK